MSIDGSLDNFSRLIVDCRHATDDVLTGVRQFHDHLMNDGIDNREGISLLEVKNRDLLMYMAELVQLMRLISDGVTIEGDATIDRLVHIRTVTVLCDYHYLFDNIISDYRTYSTN